MYEFQWDKHKGNIYQRAYQKKEEGKAQFDPVGELEDTCSGLKLLIQLRIHQNFVMLHLFQTSLCMVISKICWLCKTS